jgi:exosortase
MPEPKSDLIPNLQNSMPAETDSRKEISDSSVRDQAIALNQTKNAGFSAGFPSPLVILGGVVIAAAFFGSDIPAWSWMFQKWSTSPDDSHGMLVPAFSAWLLWHRKDLAKFAEMNVTSLAMSLGVILIFLGILLRCTGIYTRTISLEAVAVIPGIAGIFLLFFGWKGVHWGWPSVMFLIFMVPIPGPLGGLLSSKLQSIATFGSTFVLQTMGVPAVSEGNTIWLSETQVGVAEACSGLRMMTSFFALSAAVALLIERPLWEKLLILMSAPAIAVMSNVLRIAATAMAYETGNEEMAKLIFHDLAGWLMMPLGLLFLYAELYLLSKIFETTDETALTLQF